MAPLHQLAQTRPADVRVDLRRRDVRVTQHLLHRAQIGATFQQVGRKRVPQDMGRELVGNAKQLSVAANAVPDPP